jgi:hypothetical protein
LTLPRNANSNPSQGIGDTTVQGIQFDDNLNDDASEAGINLSPKGSLISQIHSIKTPPPFQSKWNAGIHSVRNRCRSTI